MAKEDLDEFEFPHICSWDKIDPDFEDPDHQKELLRGKLLYRCSEAECHREIWLREFHPLTVSMAQLLQYQADLLEEQIRVLRLRNWDEYQMRTWDHMLLERDEKQRR